MEYQVDRLTYPSDSPPSDVELLRVHLELPLDFNEKLPTYIGQLAARTWCEAPWARMAMGLPQEDGPYGMRRFPIRRQLRQPFVDITQQMIMDIQDAKSPQAAWVAIPKGYDISQAGHRQENPVVGFMTSRQVTTFTPREGITRILGPQTDTKAEVVSGAVSERWQGKRIGTALFDASLSGFDDGSSVTATVYGHNIRAINALRKIGFKIGDVEHRHDVLEAQVSVFMMEADSVGEVRARLAESFPWLRQTVQES